MDHLSLHGQLNNPDDYLRGMRIAARVLAESQRLGDSPTESKLALLLAFLSQSKRDGLSESGAKSLIAMAWGHVHVEPRAPIEPLSSGDREAWAAWANAERLDGMGMSSYLVVPTPAACSPVGVEAPA